MTPRVDSAREYSGGHRVTLQRDDDRRWLVALHRHGTAINPQGLPLVFAAATLGDAQALVDGVLQRALGLQPTNEWRQPQAG